MVVLNQRQSHILDLLRADRQRDLYEGADAGGRKGSGLYYVSHSFGTTFEPLSKAEVDQLVDEGLIEERWEWFYRAAGAE